MKIFTDKSVENEYLLIKFTNYKKMTDFSRWKEVFIDPGVYDLTKSNTYLWENKRAYQWMEEFIKNLPKDHYFSWDYPPDMNENYTKYFIKKSWQNANQYCKYSQYIVTVQSKFKNYWNFVEWFDKYNNLKIKSEILGIGNLCRIHYLTSYIKHVLDYAFSHCKHPRIHIYGLGFRIIKYANDLAQRFNIHLSIDSTKWTRAVDDKLKEINNGYVSCRKGTRQMFFDYYLNKLQKKGINIENVKEITEKEAYGGEKEG